MLTHEEALAFWYGLVNYEQRSPTSADLKLDRMRRLLARLGDPQRRLRIIHIAGSKGKGSTSAMLASVLRQAGHRTGLFTSPHLCRVEERFQVDGRPISSDELTALLSEVHDCVAWGGTKAGGVTFFEVATAVGLLHFVRRRVNAAVIEVGLGGRLDSTNVCDPTVAVITSISHDHTQVLGDRLESIAREKAGIVKPGRPVVSGATVPEARGVIEAVCQQRHARLAQLGRDFHYTARPGWQSPSEQRRPQVQVRTKARSWPWMELNLLGDHQAANAAVAVAVIEELRRQGWHVPDEAVASGLATVEWPARLEVVRRAPLTVLDCAHNVASARALVETLRESFPPTRRFLIFASSADKDVASIFRALAPAFDHVFLTRFTANPRSVPPERLAELLHENAEVPATVCRNPTEALAAAQASLGPDDLLCITGSVFFAGELRPLVLPTRPT